MPGDFLDLAALRVVIDVTATAMQLNSTEALEMTLPSSDDIGDFSGAVDAFWYELRDLSDVVIWRRITRSPIDPTMEVHADDGMLTSVAAPTVTQFSVVVPQLADAVYLAVFGVPTSSGSGLVSELGVIDLPLAP